MRAKVAGGLALSLLQTRYEIETPKGPIAFALLGLGSAKRSGMLLMKQPETIAWIDSFRPDSVFWDIGANIGIYALYAALRGDVKVVAFEPAAVNYFLLAANCELNHFDDRMNCFLLGLGEGRGVARLEVSQFEPASSFSFRGKPREPRTGRQTSLILSIDQVVEEFGVPCPTYIKIDVPDLGEAILRGGARTLPRPEVRDIHIEAGDDPGSDQRIAALLDHYGFAVAGRHERAVATDLTFTKRT